MSAAPWRDGEPFSVLRDRDGTFMEVDVHEVERALNQMKRRKAPGFSGVTVDLLKDAFPIISGEMVSVINTVFEGLQLPAQWEECLLILLHKKGDRSEPQNYRPINLTESLFRLAERVAWNRLQWWFEEYLGEEQFGFRRGKSTSDHLLVARTMVERAKALGSTMVSLDMGSNGLLTEPINLHFTLLSTANSY